VRSHDLNRLLDEPG